MAATRQRGFRGAAAAGRCGRPPRLDGRRTGRHRPRSLRRGGGPARHLEPPSTSRTSPPCSDAVERQSRSAPGRCHRRPDRPLRGDPGQAAIAGRWTSGRPVATATGEHVVESRWGRIAPHPPRSPPRRRLGRRPPRLDPTGYRRNDRKAGDGRLAPSRCTALGARRREQQRPRLRQPAAGGQSGTLGWTADFGARGPRLHAGVQAALSRRHRGPSAGGPDGPSSSR